MRGRLRPTPPPRCRCLRPGAGPTDPRVNCGLGSFFFFQAEDGIRDLTVTGVQTCALPIFTECVEVPREGRVAAVSVAHVDRTGIRLSHPQVWAFVTFRGIRGGLVHRLLVPPDRARAGLAVRPKLKPRNARVGAITDIEGFEPVGS